MHSQTVPAKSFALVETQFNPAAGFLAENTSRADLVGYALGYLTVDQPAVKKCVAASDSAADAPDETSAASRSQVVRPDAFETAPVRLELAGSIIPQTCASARQLLCEQRFTLCAPILIL